MGIISKARSIEKSGKAGEDGKPIGQLAKTRKKNCRSKDMWKTLQDRTISTGKG